jgi:hypothetical protein
MVLDVVILSDDFAGMERKSCFRVTRSRQEAQIFAAVAGTATDGFELLEAWEPCVAQASAVGGNRCAGRLHRPALDPLLRTG